MTDDDLEQLRILAIKQQNAEEHLFGLRLRNTYPMTAMELADHRVAIYAAEIEAAQTGARIRLLQESIAKRTL